MAGGRPAAGRSRSAPLPGGAGGADGLPQMECELDPLLGSAVYRGPGAMRRRLWTGIGALMLFTAGIAVGTVVSSHTSSHSKRVHVTHTQHTEAKPQQPAPKSEPAPALPTGGEKLFDQLSPSEIKAVAASVEASLGVASSSATAKPFQDYLSGVGSIGLLPTPKADAIRFLDAKGPEPPRYARVVVARPGKLDVVEYKVGPITGTRANPTVADNAPVQLVADGEIPYARRAPEIGDPSLNSVIARVQTTLRPLLIKYFGKAWAQFETEYDPKAAGHIVGWPIFPDLESTTTSRVSMVKYFWMANEMQINAGMWMHPVPLVYRLNQTGGDPADTTTHGFYFCNQGPYGSAEEVVASEADFAGCKWSADALRDTWPGSWDVAGPPAGKPNPRTSKGAPGQQLPDGPRWSSSTADGAVGKQVSWMGWSFFVSVDPAKGLGVWDIRFKGDRVVYELSLQEAAAVYSGGQGDQTYYLDSAMTGMGQFSPSLRRGIDCPKTAEALYTTSWATLDTAKGSFFVDPTVATTVPSGCIFEHDTAKPLWSHVNLMTGTTDGVRGSELVVRVLTNSGNYDYYNTVTFKLDGSLRYDSEFAGMMETRWYSKDFNDWEKQLSPIVHESLAAPIHSHLINVKVDIDIADATQNSLHVTRSVTGTPPEGGSAWNSKMVTKYLTNSYVTEEGAGKSTFVHNPRSPGVWKVVSKGTAGPASKFGWAPGYAILPGETMVNTLPDDHPLSKCVAFAKYTIAVTERKDSEQHSTSQYDVYQPGNPRTSLDHMLDGDDLTSTDLVAWVTLPHEHLPRTEDVPLITNYQVGFAILPWNYFSPNAAMDLPEVAAQDGEC